MDPHQGGMKENNSPKQELAPGIQYLTRDNRGKAEDVHISAQREKKPLSKLFFVFFA